MLRFNKIDRNRPLIIILGWVHPSETASSFIIEGLV